MIKNSELDVEERSMWWQMGNIIMENFINQENEENTFLLKYRLDNKSDLLEKSQVNQSRILEQTLMEWCNGECQEYTSVVSGLKWRVGSTCDETEKQFFLNRNVQYELGSNTYERRYLGYPIILEFTKVLGVQNEQLSEYIEKYHEMEFETCLKQMVHAICKSTQQMVSNQGVNGYLPTSTSNFDYRKELPTKVFILNAFEPGSGTSQWVEASKIIGESFAKRNGQKSESFDESKLKPSLSNLISNNLYAQIPRYYADCEMTDGYEAEHVINREFLKEIMMSAAQENMEKIDMVRNISETLCAFYHHIRLRELADGLECIKEESIFEALKEKGNTVSVYDQARAVFQLVFANSEFLGQMFLHKRFKREPENTVRVREVINVKVINQLELDEFEIDELAAIEEDYDGLPFYLPNYKDNIKLEYIVRETPEDFKKYFELAETKSVGFYNELECKFDYGNFYNNVMLMIPEGLPSELTMDLSHEEKCGVVLRGFMSYLEMKLQVQDEGKFCNLFPVPNMGMQLKPGEVGFIAVFCRNSDRPEKVGIFSKVPGLRSNILDEILPNQEGELIDYEGVEYLRDFFKLFETDDSGEDFVKKIKKGRQVHGPIYYGIPLIIDDSGLVDVFTNDTVGAINPNENRKHEVDYMELFSHKTISFTTEESKNIRNSRIFDTLFGRNMWQQERKLQHGDLEKFILTSGDKYVLGMLFMNAVKREALGPLKISIEEYTMMINRIRKFSNYLEFTEDLVDDENARSYDPIYNEQCTQRLCNVSLLNEQGEMEDLVSRSLKKLYVHKLNKSLGIRLKIEKKIKLFNSQHEAFSNRKHRAENELKEYLPKQGLEVGTELKINGLLHKIWGERPFMYFEMGEIDEYSEDDSVIIEEVLK